MRIGIDIDDTITNSWDYLMPIYSQEFNVTIEETSLPYYNIVKDIMTYDEFLEICKKHEILKKEIPLKEDAQEILTKLKKEGHEIIFITARGKSYNNPYQFTKDYLDKHNIPYDKIIVDSLDKSIACKNEKIDLFIDDNPKHCKEVLECGINVLMMDAKFNKQYDEFLHVKNWKEVYKYIQDR